MLAAALASPVPPSLSAQGSYGGLVGAGFVHLDGDLLIVNEWNTILTATLRRGGQGPRAMLSQRAIIAHAGRDTAQTFSLRVHNGGREALWVEGVESDEVHFLQNGLVIPPQGYGDVSLQVQPEVAESTYFVLQTNDPIGQQRGVHVSLMDDNYAPGDEVPPFRVPSINHCDEASDDALCDMMHVCFDSRTPLEAGRPLLIAFFSTW